MLKHSWEDASRTLAADTSPGLCCRAAVSEDGEDELQVLLQQYSTGADSADGCEQQQLLQQPSQQVGSCRGDSPR